MGFRRLVAGATLILVATLALPGLTVASTDRGAPARAPAATAATRYRNCTSLNAKYPHGVGRKGAKDHVSSGDPVTTFKVNDALYTANKHLDRDKDGVACEKR